MFMRVRPPPPATTTQSAIERHALNRFKMPFKCPLNAMTVTAFYIDDYFHALNFGRRPKN